LPLETGVAAAAVAPRKDTAPALAAGRTLEADPQVRESAGPYITSGPELAAHLAARGKEAVYGRLLADLGVEGGAERVYGRTPRPSLLFGEQPGCWYTALDLARARLRRALVERFGFDPEFSGLYSLGTDRLTSSGEKAVFLRFSLFTSVDTLGPAHLIGSALLRRYAHTIYDTLAIAGPLHARLRMIWGYSLTMLEAAERSRDEFVDAVASLFGMGIEHGMRKLLPPSNGRRQNETLADKLRRHDLASANAVLRNARDSLTEGIVWTDYWDRVNQAFLAEEVRAMGPTFAHYLLAVSDPVKMARHLISLGDQDPGQPVSVAGFVDQDGRFRKVNFEPRTGGFFFERADQRWPIEWQDLRARAAAGTARPSGTLLYLLLAAGFHYMLIDPGDELQPFQEAACAAHRRATGLKFPWVKFSMDDAPGRTGVRNTFLEAYHPEFNARVAAMIGRFIGDS
jgi:hypothetical protein